ncbi:MAG: multidrug effflux MFS transporter [Gammaproteobacteria bacterium]|nr:multidrug effflux MFS transporter [Gammaproteobacteria bacterium]MDH5652532.1 multidrug effflux MFS transporter [Gammaproteobacteria bacterium]
MSDTSHHKLMILLLALLAMVAPFCIDTYLPSFPSIAKDLGASPVEMQQSLSLYLLGFAVMTLFYGSLSDALGRRTVILFAIGGFTLTSIGLYLARSTDVFLFLRLIQGGFASAGIVVGRAVVRDLFHSSQAQRVMSTLMLIFGVAPAIAPIIGGWLETAFGWRSIFMFLTLFGLLLLVLVSWRLPETLPKDKRHSMHPITLLKNYGHALSRFHFLELCLITALNFGGFFLYITSSPQIMFEHLGLTAADFHIMFVPMVGGMMLGAFLNGRTAGRLQVKRALQLGYLVMLLGSLWNVANALWLPVTAFNLISPLVLYGVGMSFCMPMLSILGLDELPNHRGLASSLQSFVHMSMNAFVAGVVAPLVFHTVRHLALSMLLMFGISLLMFINVNRRKSLEYLT